MSSASIRAIHLDFVCLMSLLADLETPSCFLLVETLIRLSFFDMNGGF